ncbi:hypothetical protein LCGC14_1918310 [marine sediment metagenome]|uniref:DUF4340 domain-containing protein n=1 Tax=marine sediment metagenome TaxID=412755 RepID=A0A0F9IPC3_9ZZZZ
MKKKRLMTIVFTVIITFMLTARLMITLYANTEPGNLVLTKTAAGDEVFRYVSAGDSVGLIPYSTERIAENDDDEIVFHDNEYGLVDVTFEHILEIVGNDQVIAFGDDAGEDEIVFDLNYDLEDNGVFDDIVFTLDDIEVIFKVKDDKFHIEYDPNELTESAIKWLEGMQKEFPQWKATQLLRSSK